MRKLSIINEEEEKITLILWHNRHLLRRSKIESGETKLVSRAEYDAAPAVYGGRAHLMVDEIWAGAEEFAKRVEAEYGTEFPDNQIEHLEMIGKLMALRWVLGDEWEETMSVLA